MTQKDYELIAVALRESKPNSYDDQTGEKTVQWKWTVETVISKIKDYNPKFSPSKFKEWAGVTDEVQKGQGLARQDDNQRQKRTGKRSRPTP